MVSTRSRRIRYSDILGRPAAGASADGVVYATTEQLGDLEAELALEASRRAGADDVLRASLASEAATREADDDTETAARIAADATLTAGLVAEGEDRAAADAVLAADIAAETAARIAADLLLQPLDSDLTAIAALATTAYGRSLLTLADAAALGGLFIDVSVSSSASLTIAMTLPQAVRVFNGSTDATWALPAIAGHSNRLLVVKHRGTADLTLTGTIFSDAEVPSLPLVAGESYTFVNDGTYWIAI
jgi:hypothetical protein